MYNLHYWRLAVFKYPALHQGMWLVGVCSASRVTWGSGGVILGESQGPVQFLQTRSVVMVGKHSTAAEDHFYNQVAGHLNSCYQKMFWYVRAS